MLRILLKKWADKVKDAKDAEFENVWDKKSFRAANNAGPEIVVEASDEKTVTANESSNVSDQGAETGVIGNDRKQMEFTVEELFRRMRRIEKLTRMIKSEDGILNLRGSGATDHLRASGPPSRQDSSLKTHTLSTAKMAALTDSMKIQKTDSEVVLHQDTDALLK